MTGAKVLTMIVTLPGADDLEAIRKRVSKIKGVYSVEFNCFSRKLRVSYDGNEKRNTEILAEIRKAISP